MVRVGANSLTPSAEALTLGVDSSRPRALSSAVRRMHGRTYPPCLPNSSFPAHMPTTKPSSSKGSVTPQLSTSVDLPRDDDLSLRDFLKNAQRGRWIIICCDATSLAVGHRGLLQTADTQRAWPGIHVKDESTPNTLGITRILAPGTRDLADHEAAVPNPAARLRSELACPEFATRSIFEGRLNCTDYLPSKALRELAWSTNLGARRLCDDRTRHDHELAGVEAGGRNAE